MRHAQIKLEALLTPAFPSTMPTATLHEAAQTMLRNRLSAITVLADGQAVGVLTGLDFARAIDAQRSPTTRVQEMMSPAVNALSRETELCEAQRSLLGQAARCLAVVDAGGQTLGVLGASELLSPQLAGLPVEPGSIGIALHTLVPRLSERDSLQDALDMMIRCRAPAVFICRGEELRGILTERDMPRLFEEPDCDGARPLADLMHTQPLRLGLNASLADAGRCLSEAGAEPLAVTDAQGRLAGQIGVRELLQHLSSRATGDSRTDDAGEGSASAARFGVSLYQQALIDNCPFPVWLKDSDSRYLAVNRPFAEACGLSEPEDLVGKTDLDVWPRELAESYRADDRRVMLTRRQEQLEEQVEKAGKRAWFETYKAPVFNPDGSVCGTVGFARDISHRRALEEQMRLLATAVSQSPLSIVVTDTDGSIVFVNDHFTETTGYGREEVLGQNPRILKSGETPDEIYASLWATITRGETWRGELCNRKKNGELCLESVRIAPVRDHAGRISHYIGIKQDVTRQKEIDARLRLGEYNLRQAQRVARVGSWYLDIPTEQFSWSDETYRIFGMQPDSPLDQDSLIACIHPEDRESVQSAWQAAMQGGEYDIRHRIQVGDEVRWVHERAQISFDDQGVPLSGIGTVQDITELKGVQDRLAESETNFRLFFDQIRDFLFVLDARGNIIHVNRYVTRRLGYGAQELIGRSVLRLHPKERHQEASRIIADMLAGKADHCSIPLRTRSGQLIPVETYVVAGEWDGAPALFGVSRDLSSLAASEEKFSKAFHHSPIAMAITELTSGTFIEVNSAFCRDSGYSSEEVIGKSSISLGIVVDASQRECMIEAVRLEGVARDLEMNVCTKDGQIRHGLFNAALVDLQDRQVLMTQMLDISERKTAEISLRENESLLRATLNSTADGILVVDHAGEVITANQQFQTLWGIPDDLMHHGDDEKLLAFMCDQLTDPKAFVDEVARLYGSEETARDSLHFRDGRVFERYSVPLHLSRGLSRVWSFRDITLQEHALAELQQERGFLKTLVQTIPDLVWLKDPNGVYLACNQKFEELYGAGEAEIVGRTDYDFVDKETADFFRANDLAAMSAGEPRRNEEWLTFKASGYRGLFEATKTSMYRADKTLIGVLGIAHDITTVRQAEQAIREIEIRRSALMDMSLDGIAVINQDHRVVEANARFSEILGYNREEILRLHTWDWEANLSEAEVRASFADLTKVETRFETRHRRKDGSTFDVEVSASGREVGGEPLVFTICRDITENKKAVQNLRAQRDLFSGGPTMVFCWLPEEGWPVDFCSANVEQVLGYPSEQLMRGDITYTTLIHPDDLSVITGEVAGHMADGTDTFEQEYRLRHADGRYLIFYDYTRILRDESGDVRLIYGYLLDITRQRVSEQARLRMERELQQARKMEALGQLTGGVAHEFNNMLAIILGHAELLRTRLGPEADPRLSAYLNHIGQAGGRAKELIRQMLTFSRPRENQRERLALQPAIQEAITLTQGGLPSSIEIDYRSGSGLPDVRLDMGELQQVLTNLLVNARDAMEGKGRIEVSLGWYRDGGEECQSCHTRILGDWVEVGVADSGPGITADELPSIFVPFYTTKSVGKGTGLGLSVVQGIVKHNGGHILVDTRAGGGTRFRLLFPPLAWENAQPAQAPEASEAGTRLSGRVLLVDDEPALLEFMRELLVEQGLEVSACRGGREALSLLLEAGQAYQLLITDQTMPGLLGTELAAEAKARQPDLKVMLCTGYSEQVNAANAQALGIDRYLPKPVQPEELKQVVKGLLEEASQTGETA